MKTELMNLPEAIRNKRNQLLSAAEVIESTSLEIKKFEIIAMDAIANAVDDYGKPAFSNAEKRQAELIRRKSEDIKFTGMEKDLQTFRRAYEQEKIELQHMIDVQENYRAIARLGGGDI
jgi:hypothetical protein